MTQGLTTQGLQPDGTTLERAAGLARIKAPVSIANGGTAATTAAGAKINLLIDLLTDLSTAEKAITGADTALISRMNVCNSGASYAVTLPAATGNTGKICGIRVKEAVTGLITLTCTGAEKLYGSGDNVGSATRVMWAGESAILLSDGANWYKIMGKTIAMKCLFRFTAATHATAIGTWVVDYNNHGSSVYDVGGIGDKPNNKIIIKRAGKYRCTMQAYFGWNSGAATDFMQQISDVALALASTSNHKKLVSGTMYQQCAVCTLMNLTAAQEMQHIIYTTQADTIYGNAAADYTSISYTEEPEW